MPDVTTAQPNKKRGEGLLRTIQSIDQSRILNFPENRLFGTIPQFNLSAMLDKPLPMLPEQTFSPLHLGLIYGDDYLSEVAAVSSIVFMSDTFQVLEPPIQKRYKTFQGNKVERHMTILPINPDIQTLSDLQYEEFVEILRIQRAMKQMYALEGKDVAIVLKEGTKRFHIDILVMIHKK
jgi:hypothetical protein